MPWGERGVATRRASRLFTVGTVLFMVAEVEGEGGDEGSVKEGEAAGASTWGWGGFGSANGSSSEKDFASAHHAASDNGNGVFERFGIRLGLNADASDAPAYDAPASSWGFRFGGSGETASESQPLSAWRSRAP